MTLSLNPCLPICSAKYAVAAIKRKIHDKNPHVAKFGLIVSIVFLYHSCAWFLGCKRVDTSVVFSQFKEINFNIRFDINS